MQTINRQIVFTPVGDALVASVVQNGVLADTSILAGIDKEEAFNLARGVITVPRVGELLN